ncbi:HNH endonuclease signature motif containing protein [Corynebacterium uterequi]|uniref:HNH endonuclease n=1 Tax=Corynebacterium uterequi TaxID=1072256 RepID=A0A0G3HIB6_9CORY|nr:HNH endonuclease signature motif containing protein [Corynebacterium uterequi]AKK10882.1 hypothetical protein CUTER_04385 [Corynebacterium uterequi]
MNVASQLNECLADGIGLLDSLSEHGELPATLLSRSQRVRLRSLVDIYAGPRRARRKQRACRDTARAAHMSLHGLLAIEKQMTKLSPKADTWGVRARLCALTGSVDDIARAAAAIVRQENRKVDPSEESAHRLRGVKGGKNTDGAGCRTFTTTGPESDIQRMLAVVHSRAVSLRARDRNLTYEQARFDALKALILGGTDKPASQLRATALVVISLPDWARVLRGEGDDVVLATTGGIEMTGAQLVEHLVSEEHLVGLYDPVEGPVNLYRTKRHHSPKMGVLADAESIVCEWPGCSTPADQCQNHHLTAWAAGGETSVDNITKLCPTHNGRNDDRREAPRYGHVTRVEGRVVWMPPDGGPPDTNHHPIKDYSAAALIRR